MESALIIITVAAVIHYLKSVFAYDIPLWREHVSGLPLVKGENSVIDPTTGEPCFAYWFRITHSLDGKSHRLVAEETRCAPFCIQTKDNRREFEFLEPKLVARKNTGFMGTASAHDPSLIKLLDYCNISLPTLNGKKSAYYYSAQMKVIPLHRPVVVSEIDEPVISDFGWINQLRWFAIRTAVVFSLVMALVYMNFKSLA